VALSTTEAELIAVVKGLRTAIPLMRFIDELHCKMFEDNMGAMNIPTMPKIRTRTKYINVNTGTSGSFWNKVKYQFTQCVPGIR